MEHLITIVTQFWGNYFLEILLLPLILPGIVFWFVCGNLCCPDRIDKYTSRFPEPVQFFVCGIAGIPIYILMMTLVPLLMIPFQILGVLIGKSGGDYREPRINNEIDVDG